MILTMKNMAKKNDILISETHAYQWPFQDPKLEVPTIYKAYIRPKFQGNIPTGTHVFDLTLFVSQFFMGTPGQGSDKKMI